MNLNKTVERTIEALRTKRQRLGLSIRDVEDTTGISSSTLSRFENHKGAPDLYVLSVLMTFCEIDWVYDDQPVAVTSQQTLENIRQVIYADANLEPKIAGLLDRILSDAYQTVSTNA